MSTKSAEPTWQNINLYKFYLYSSLFFFCIRTLVYPSSLIKTRLQVGNRSTWQQGGLKSLYRGFWITAIGAIPSQVIYLTAYEWSKHNATPIAERLELEKLSNFVGGGMASLCSQSVIVPVDVVSQRMMIASSTHPLKAYDVFKEIVKKEGVWRGLFRGFGMSVLTYAPSSAVWWGTYGITKPIAEGVVNSKLWATTLSGCIAGTASAVILCPMDVLKTRQQTSQPHQKFSAVYKQLVKQEGLMSLFRGTGARLLHSIPVSIMMIHTYETVKFLSAIE